MVDFIRQEINVNEVQHGSAYDRPSSASSENMVTYPEEM
jgi:hypothetical protein